MVANELGTQVPYPLLGLLSSQEGFFELVQVGCRNVLVALKSTPGSQAV